MSKSNENGEWVCSCPICRRIVYPLLKKKKKVKEKVEKEPTQNEKNSIDSLKEVVDALKESVAELKATIGDLSNPLFSLSSEAKQKEAKEVEKSTEKQVQMPKEEIRENKEEVEEVKTPVKRREPVLFKETVKMLKILYSLSEKMPGDMIDDYISLMKEIGISEEKTLDVIRLLNQIVQKGIKSNISLQDQLLSIYILSKAMGFSEPEIEEEVAQILIDYIKKGDKQG